MQSMLCLSRSMLHSKTSMVECWVVYISKVHIWEAGNLFGRISKNTGWKMQVFVWRTWRKVSYILNYMNIIIMYLPLQWTFLQVLQTFHRSKAFKGSPLKCERLQAITGGRTALFMILALPIWGLMIPTGSGIFAWTLRTRYCQVFYDFSNLTHVF